MSEVNELRYIDCIVKEALRLYPVLPFLTRKTSEDMEIGRKQVEQIQFRWVNLNISDGHKVPAGVQAIVHIFAVQRDPKEYTDPDKFIPERFTPENSKNRHPFSFIPFSAGPRNCLGKIFKFQKPARYQNTLFVFFRNEICSY